ncbi:MAG TPA: M24 family metallopeptidase [Candidatus Limnocylindrales bacterium]|nr:M24 family metallopeptidase [Candidatus Limnocylindrales bacterium]
MKSDLNRLMEARGLDGVIAMVNEAYSPPVDYLTNGARITNGMVIQKRGAAPLLFANPMEVEEAARSGLEVITFGDLGYYDLLETLDDREQATVQLWGRALARAGMTEGTIGLYGTADVHTTLALVQGIERAFPQIHFYSEMGISRQTLFGEAMATKDGDELLRLRSVAARTDDVLQATWDYLASHVLDGERVVDAQGRPLTIGGVKRFVRRALLDRDLEDTDMIFAQGRDAGFPHSRGEEDAELVAGLPIVFDLFPREVGGGYFHDTTRTWTPGYARPEVEDIYAQVMDAFDVAIEAYRPGMATKDMQLAVMDYFEGKGHATQRSQPGTNAGYTHSLGHGIGLNIHERPGIGHLSSDTFRPGNVITIEPGLYYPERELGVRIEDSLYIDAAGQLLPLTRFKKDLVIPLKPSP